MNLDGIDLDAMTEMELRALKRERAVERARDDITVAYQRDLREQMLAIQDVMGHKQQARYAVYAVHAATTPGARSTQIDVSPATASSGAPPPN